MKKSISQSGTRVYYTGPKGGYFYINQHKKKIYVKEVPEGAILNHFNCRGISHIRVKTCCVCGKPLTETDTNYYDLSSYCIDCAIADGIRTSY